MLGIIPTWQFSADPKLNPGLNRFVRPSSAWQPPVASGAHGLGYVMVDASRSRVMAPTIETLRATGQIDGASDWFRSGGWIYEHRKLLIGSGIALGGLAFIVTKIL